MVVSTVQVRSMRYVVGRNRQEAARQLIITFIHVLINFIYVFVSQDREIFEGPIRETL